MKPASLGQRVVAFLIDLGLWSSIGVLVLGPTSIGLYRLLPKIADAQLTASKLPLDDALWFLALALMFLGSLGALCVLFDIYCFRFERRYGATLGKGMVGICVRDAVTGALPTRRQCLWREVLRMFEVAAIFPAILAIAVDAKRRRIGDRVAGTLVVASPSELHHSSFPFSAVTPAEFAAAPARGRATLTRKALVLGADIGVALLLLTPIDMIVSGYEWIPILAKAARGADVALNPDMRPSALWLLLIPVYLGYVAYARAKLAGTVGERLLGVRRGEQL